MSSDIATANTIQTLFESNKDQLSQLIPKHVSADRLVRIAIAAISRNPILMKCSQTSLLASLMDAAKLGLEASGPLGEGYLVPYFNSQRKEYEAQFQPGYRGLVTLARRSGVLKEIDARIVHENDFILVEYGVHKKLEHRPVLSGEPGKIIAAYAIFHLEGGGVQFDIMTLPEINAVRARSKAKDSGPWVTDFEEMAKKTVIKRGLKLVPLSVELAEAIEADNRIEYDLDLSSPEPPIPTPKEKTAEDRGKKREEKKVSPVPEPEKKEDPVFGTPPPSSVSDRITPEQVAAVKKKWSEVGAKLSPEFQKEGATFLKTSFGFEKFEDIRPDQLVDVLVAMDDIKEPGRGA